MSLISDLVLKFKGSVYDALVISLIPVRNKYQQMKLKRKVRRGEKIKLCFIAFTTSMWRYQRVSEMFKRDERFDVSIVLSPTVTFEKPDQIRDIEGLRRYFQSKKMDYVDWDFDKNRSALDLKEDINPDIIFYPQQYLVMYYPEHSYRRFIKKLLCLCPYGLAAEETSWTYNTEFHNLAWKLFYTNQSELAAARRLALNKGRNVVVTGYPNMTEYLTEGCNDVWKIKDKNIKRLIWAPHYSIDPEEDELYLSNFLRMADQMVAFAKQYQGKIQIAFKPHPKLRTKLYRHPDWGVEKTDAYYQLWANMPNTQLETGEFIDLFKSSDAMVHDCDSFQIEYLYLNKPVMFVNNGHEQQNVTRLRDEAMKCLYIGRSIDDVQNFIEMVLRGEDEMKDKRTAFFNQYLLPKNGTDVALNIYNDIISSLGI